MKYYEDEAKELQELGEIPEHIKINEGDFDEDDIDLGVHDDGKDEDLNIDRVRKQ